MRILEAANCFKKCAFTMPIWALGDLHTVTITKGQRIIFKRGGHDLGQIKLFIPILLELCIN